MRITRHLACSFRALITKEKKVPATVGSLTRAELPTTSTVKVSPGECDLHVRVSYSNINYKDALVVTGKYPGLKPPMVGGIDLVGEVISCATPKFQPGQLVLVNGFGIGTDHYGGYAEEARIRSDWAISLPEQLEPIDAAKIGTAGYTSMLCVDALVQHGVTPDSGPILVTGATGGVGSVAVALLAKMGYQVTALTGKPESSLDWFKELGATEVKARSGLESEPKPLSKEIYAGCIDTVGGVVLANALTMVRYGGTVAACGLAGGMGLSTTVAPFILRGVTLAGIDSVFAGMDKRQRVYATYAPLIADSGKLPLICGQNQIVGLEGVTEVANNMLKGNIMGRYVVKLDA